MPKKEFRAEDLIVPLNVNGLDGRMLRMPPPKGKKREIMYVYGHHASLERNFGVAEYLNRYGGVTVPDLPGFGGMQPFYKIGEKPSLDNLADYLAAFIKMRYKGQKFCLTGFSLGFMVVTRMLQRHPQMAKQIDPLVSFAGFTHKSDFKFKKSTYYLFRGGTWFFSKRLPAAFLKYVVFRRIFIKTAYAIFEPLFVSKEDTKIRNASKEERAARINFEVHLWQCNDARTYMSIAHTMFKLNLMGQYIDQTVHHIAIEGDRYFNNVKVEEHMNAIFKELHVINAKLPAHAPSIIATAKEAAPYVPEQIRRMLRKDK